MRRESSRVECKSKLTDGLEKEVVAFLNSKDGEIIYIGVDDNGKSLLLDNLDALQLKIKDRLKNNISSYGYCSLIKSTKSVLDKFNVENTTFTKITSKERIQTYLWDSVALREAIINAIIHNDYSNEIPPKFKIFNDRVEITSAESLPVGISEDDFFEGISHPKNKEIMRIFKDLELVEQLGSGVPRIIKVYKRDSFKFMDNFTRVIFYKGGQIDLTDRQIDILNLIKQTPKISRKKISEILDINQSAVLKHLENLKDKDKIEFIGAPKTGGYVVKEIN